MRKEIKRWSKEGGNIQSGSERNVQVISSLSFSIWFAYSGSPPTYLGRSLNLLWAVWGAAQIEVLSCSILCFLSKSTIASKVKLQAKCWNLNHCSYNFWEGFAFFAFLTQTLCSTLVSGCLGFFVSLPCPLTTRHKEMKVAAYLGSLGRLRQGERGV